MQTAVPAPVVDQSAPPPAEGAKRRRRRRSDRPVRTPTILQMEAVECGAASLSIVLSYYGRHETLERLRTLCGVSRDGSRASNVLRAARILGLEAKGMQTDVAGLADLPKPAILFWSFHHFLVLEGISTRRGRTKVYLNDPASGRRVTTMEDLDDCFTGVALTFSPGPDFEKGGEPSRALTGLWERRESTRGLFGLVLFVSFLLLIPGLATPAFTRVFIDRVLGGSGAQLLPTLLLVMATSALATVALTVIQQSTLLLIESRMAIVSGARFMQHLLRLPVEFFAQRQPAELDRRVRSNDAIAQVLSRDLATTVVNLGLVLFYSVELVRFDTLLGAIGLGMASLNIVVLRKVSRLRSDMVMKMRADKGKLIATSFATLSQIETVKAAGAENDAFARWAGFQAKVESGRQQIGVPSAVLAATPPFLAMVNSGLILLLGSVRAVSGAISIGLLVAFQGLLNNLSRPVSDLTNLGSKVQDVGADLVRLRDVERYPVAPIHRRDNPSVHSRVTGYVEVKDVSFSYGPLKSPQLEGFSLSVAPGRRVALVGGSGSGKSTVGRVIAGLYEPQKGVVLFDGRPRSVYSRRAIAAAVAFVDQEIFLFAGTVRENITLWDDSVGDEEVVQALKDASVYDVVTRRPGGLSAPVLEGGRNFSGGQRQRLEIARALVTRPSVLVLDEATSALDADTEWTIDDNLRRRGCACIIIAHRLSTVRDADEILVMESGRIAERGSHEQLVALGGAYAQLIQSS